MIQYQTIDGLLLREMAIAGAAVLEKNREAVDALNVFPVPDGDTGTNMSLTMQSAVREISAKEYLRADEAASALSKGALRGARGNSGVITSQLLRGFAKSLKGVEAITPVQFAQALKMGSDLAYKAVMKPKEGTILTVARVVAESALRQVEQAPDDYDALFNVILKSGADILKQTPDMLPPLKAAGVVDSGGSGLMHIYTGYAAVLRGEDINALLAAQEEEKNVFGEDHSLLTEVTQDYSVEYRIQNLREGFGEEDVNALRRRLNRTGDSVKVIEDGADGYKVHIHTDHPGNAVEFGLELGELVDFRLENIAVLHRPAPAEEEAEIANKPFGMVAVSLGEGFSRIFKDLTVDEIVEGGQTMNPCTEDILSAIQRIHADCVFVFPNNGNVELAAEQAAHLAHKEGRQVYVIPTKNVAMGIAAAIAFQPDLSGEENAKHMREAAECVRTCTVTYAVRDSEYNGIQIKQGDIIGLYNGQITDSGKNVHDVVVEMMRDIVTEDDGLITVYYGADVTQEEAEALTAEIARAYDGLDTECHFGGQPLYYYLISVE